MNRINNTSSWTVLGGRTLRPTPFCLAGILNITPDSFSSVEQEIPEHHSVVARARTMLASATATPSFEESQKIDADAPFENCTVMLDLGAESTRPNSKFVHAEEEGQRLFPALSAVLKAFPTAIVSVDTCRATVAEEALARGAVIVNDVSACSRDNALFDVVVGHKAGYVLMHGGAEHWAGKTGCAATPLIGKSYNHVIDRVLSFFEKNLQRFIAAGLPETCIVLDPGIGFGKTPEENWALLQHIEQLNVFGRPIYMGLSNKSLFGYLLGLSVHHRQEVTCLATALLAARGVAYHRVHDVAAATQALRVVQTMTTL